MKKTISPEGTFRRLTGKRSGWMTAAALCGAIFVAVTLSSCSNDSTTGVSSESLAGSALTPEHGNSPANGPSSQNTFPTIRELSDLLDLSPQQISIVASALADFRKEVQPKMQSIIHSQGQFPGQGLALGRNRLEATGAQDVIVALVQFLSDVSDELSAQQLTTLVDFLMDRMPVLEMSLGAQTSFFVSTDVVMEFADQNHLTAAQRSDLLDAVRTANEAYAELQQQILQGQISGQAITTQAMTIQQQFNTEVQSILGTQLYTNFTTFVQQSRTDTINSMIQSLSTRVSQQYQLLSSLLDLTAQQQTQLQTALQTAQASYQTLLTGINNGTITFDQALAQSIQIRTSLNSSIQASLTPDQLSLYNSISFLFVQPFGILFI